MMKKQYFFMLFLVISTLNLTAQSPHFFGVTQYSDTDKGVIFRTDTNGTNLSTKHIFKDTNTGFWSFNGNKLIEINSKFYGVVHRGGIDAGGVLFEYNPVTNDYTVKHYFIDSSGIYPNGPMMQASNGKLYGITSYGGANNGGVIFEFSPATGIYSKKADFTAVFGSDPTGFLVEPTPGVFMGVCNRGGANNAGSIFQYTLSTDTLILKDDFDANVNGHSPVGGLLKTRSGKILGVCLRGGAINQGTIYEYDFVGDSISKMAEFTSTTGTLPLALPYESISGKFYLTTSSQATNNRGAVCEFDYSTKTLTKKLDINPYSSGPGYGYVGSFIGGATNKLLITSLSDPGSRDGFVSEYDMVANTFIKRKPFNNYVTGTRPTGTLTRHSLTGKYYSITDQGGKGNSGTLFEFDDVLDTIITKIHLGKAKDLTYCTSTLLKASNGKLYGTTGSGGNGVGGIFEFDPTTDKYEKLAEFTADQGKDAQGNIVEYNGKIYGTTFSGGLYDKGVIWSYDIATRTISKKHDFDGYAYWCYGGLMKAANNKMYGTTAYSYVSPGYSNGSIFEYDPVLDSFQILAGFNSTMGSNPRCALLEATNGKLYGTTNRGGSNNEGTVFEYDFAIDSIRKVASFDNSNNGYTPGNLIQTTTGKIFGVTSNGGANSRGTLFEVDLVTDTLVVKADFIRYLIGYGGKDIMEASNGKIYGVSSYTSNSSGSKIYEFNPVTNVLAWKNGFYNGSRSNTGLVEIVSPNSIGLTENEKAVSFTVTVFPNPTSDYLTYELEQHVNEIRIYNMRGQLIELPNPNRNKLDVSKYPKGTYVIQLFTDNGIALSRFIKQ